MNGEGLILVIENDMLKLESNKATLTRDGYTVLTAATLAEARAHLAYNTPDAVVLDVSLPDGSGIDFLAELRKNYYAPVLFLTTKNSHSDCLAALAAGGNDYIYKPYDVDELCARIKNFVALQRSIRELSDVINLGPLRLDTIARQAFLHGDDMGLCPKEFDLLRLFASNVNRPMSLVEIYEKVWGQPLNNDMGAFKTTVSRLRAKLKDFGYAIETRRGAGYCFVKTAYRKIK